MARRQLQVLHENSVPTSAAKSAVGEARAGRLVALGRALSDPIRVTMLGMLADGRGCCDLPDCGVPDVDQEAGICVCEFERYFDVGQSRASYHLGKLKEAGLVREERRGKWSFYSLDHEVASQLLAETAAHLAVDPCKNG
ncbi:MAG TPA: metalloregulator ArsR/SmtB family transcription factor [Rubrobacter sp.]|nr:metalloregulator ArsR/SmtB family transcription factor [Rubrobacter sp.]